MAHRNGTYIAFAAEGQTDPTLSDIKYYNILKGWHGMESKTFRMINSHDKVAACRDTSSKETIKRSLRERLNLSKRLLLLIGDRTRFDDDFVPYELDYGIKSCNLPVICCYVKESEKIINYVPDKLRSLWPSVLKQKIDEDAVKTIHIPFGEKIIFDALNNYDFEINRLIQLHFTQMIFTKVWNLNDEHKFYFS